MRRTVRGEAKSQKQTNSRILSPPARTPLGMQRRLVQYFAAFALCLFAIQKLDDVGSGWAAQGNGGAPEECTVSGQGVVRSPICTARQVAGQTLARLAQTPFCAAHTPWFWYNLGGGHNL